MQKAIVALLALGIMLARGQYPSADLTQEPQLQRAVSLKYPVISLQELCRRLSAQLGVSLQVEKPLQALSATLYVRQQPASEVLTRLATTFRAEWKRIEEDNQVRYLLVRQPAVKTEEQRLDALLKMDGVKLLRDALRRLPPQLLEMSPAAVRDEVNNPDSPHASVFLTTKSPDNALSLENAQKELLRDLTLQLASPDSWLCVHLIRQFSDAEWDNLRRGATIELSAEQVPPALIQQYLRSDVEIMKEYYKMSQQAEATDEREPAVLPKEPKTIRFRYLHEERRLECRIESTVQPEEPTAPDEIAMPGSYTGLAHFPCLSEDFLRDLSAYRTENDYESLMQLREKSVILGRTLDEATRTRMRNDWINYAAYMLVDAAEQLQYHLIGEWTPMHSLSEFGWHDLGTWQGLVSHLGYDYAFHFESGWLTFRPKATVMMRRFAIPVETLRQWLKPDAITLDCLSQIVSQCRAVQIEGLVALRKYGLAAFNLSATESFYRRQEGAPLAALSSAQLPAVRQWLRFYATLSPLQRKNLQKGGALSWQNLTPTQRRALVTALQTPLEDAFGMELYLIFYRLALQKPLNEDDALASEAEPPAGLQTLRIRLDNTTLAGHTYSEGESQGIPVNEQFVAFVVFTHEGKEVLRVPVRLK